MSGCEGWIQTITVQEKDGTTITYHRWMDSDVWRAKSQHGEGTLRSNDLLGDLAKGVLR